MLTSIFGTIGGVLVSLVAAVVVCLWLGIWIYRKWKATPAEGAAIDAIYPFALAAYHWLDAKYTDCPFLDKVEEYKDKVKSLHIEQAGKFISEENLNLAVSYLASFVSKKKA